ncbi:Unknown protein sequence [Pseudomonas amygdali pv. morsprunorum]|nr:Unknown protein sequence [Pseudomonas amygdali pv. morsprunorum]
MSAWVREAKGSICAVIEVVSGVIVFGGTTVWHASRKAKAMSAKRGRAKIEWTSSAKPYFRSLATIDTASREWPPSSKK